jgi:hypothetical protein
MMMDEDVMDDEATFLARLLKPDDALVAKHEAGHAVIAAVLREQFRYVAIGYAVLADGPVYGHVRWVNRNSYEERKRFCERNAIVFFAGPIAEGQGSRNLGNSNDFMWANRMIRRVFPGTTEYRTNRKRLWDQTERLVSDHQASIEAVSRELLAKRRLSYREVRKIIAIRQGSGPGHFQMPRHAVSRSFLGALRLTIDDKYFLPSPGFRRRARKAPILGLQMRRSSPMPLQSPCKAPGSRQSH